MAAGAEHAELAIWERIIRPSGPMNVTTARQVLRMKFSAEEHRRMKALLAQNRAGTLTPADKAELDGYCRVGTLLTGLKSRARLVLKPRSKRT